jgi:membrane fusion protein (multidrug efflux system)
MKSEGKKKGFGRFVPVILVVTIAIVGAGLWYNEYSKYWSTDDAHLESDMVSVSAKMLGRINRLYVEEGSPVKRGQLVAELDSTDLLAQRDQAVALKEQAEANVAQAQAKYKFDQVSINVVKVNLDKAKEDMARAKKQFDGGVLTKEQFDHISKAEEMVRAQMEAAINQLNVSKAMIHSAMSAVNSAEAQINTANTMLGNTRLYAPLDGVIGKRWLLPGDVVQPSQSIFTITDPERLWVSVFLEETKVGRIHPGQPATFTLDAFPGTTFTGKVMTIGANTAGQFSLIPASNASGNFTKVTQRVELKISIEGTEDQQDLSSFNLLSGMSASIKIKKEGK